MHAKNIILEIAENSRKEKWHFLQTFSAFKKEGLISYLVDFTNNKIIYQLPNQSFEESIPELNHCLSVNSQFNSKGVDYALELRFADKISYLQFLDEIAKAGIEKYRVDTASNTVNYLGISGECYVQKIPV